MLRNLADEPFFNVRIDVVEGSTVTSQWSALSSVGPRSERTLAFDPQCMSSEYNALGTTSQMPMQESAERALGAANHIAFRLSYTDRQGTLWNLDEFGTLAEQPVGQASRSRWSGLLHRAN